MIILGFVAILLMGITLGLLGAGGSILTVPILVYLFHINPLLSTSYSLVLVGFTALVGAFFYYRKKQIDFHIAVKFALPSIIAVYATRRFLLPLIPDHFSFFNIVIAKNLLILVLFAVMMFLTALFMIKDSSVKLPKGDKADMPPYLKNLFIIVEAALVGVITAIVGAGGGFLIVPALVLLNKINVKTAIGTSLFIIAAKSLIGFVGDIQNKVNLDYMLALQLVVLSSVGMFLGTLLGKFINPDNLKKGFGYFVLLTSILIIIKEV